VSKLFVKQFENFKGLDTRSSNLTRQANFAVELENYDILKNLSIMGRKGHKIISQHSSSVSGAAFRYPYQGLRQYLHSDVITGTSQRELIGVGDKLYKLQYGYLTIEGPASSSVSLVPDDGEFVLQVGSSSISCGTGFETDFVTVKDLADAIEALAGWSVTSCTPSGIVDGGQVNRGIADGTLVIDASDISTATNVLVETTGGNVWCEVVSIDDGAETLYLHVLEWDRTTLFSVADEALIGVYLFPAASINTIKQTSSTTYSLEIPYWEPILSYGVPFEWQNVGDIDAYFANSQPNFVMRNNSSCLYIGLRRTASTDETVGGVEGRASGLGKYDGKQCYLAGMPSCTAPTLTATAGAGLEEESTYKYLIQWKHIDNKGNIVFGKDSTFDAEAEVTTTEDNRQVQITLPSLSGQFFGILNSGIVNESLATGDTVAVTTGHTLRGHNQNIFLLDRSENLVRAKKFVCEEVAETSITLTEDVDAILCQDGDPVSQGPIIQIYRTKGDGTEYYLAAEIPANGDWTTWTDSLTDDDLGEKWLGPYTGMYRRDVPPVMPIIENHQGGLVGGGGPIETESIFWSGIESVEYFPEGTNMLDLSSTEAGAVTAIASDGLDMLDVFKANSMVVIAGDLVLGNISIVDELVGDIGCPSADGWQKVRGLLLIMSEKGPRLVQNGQLIQPDDRLITYFTNNYYELEEGTLPDGSDEKFYVRYATSAHDYESQRILFFVPCLDREGAAFTINANVNSRVFVYDYANDYWTTYKLNANHNWLGGATFYRNRTVWISRAVIDTGDTNSRGLLMGALTSNTIYDFHDNCLSIPYKFRPQWEFLDEPSMDKDILKFKVWSMNRPFDFDSSIGFKTYLNFSTTTADTVTTVTLDESKISDIVKLRHNKACSFLFSFEGNSYLDSPHLTGFEYEIAVPYDKEHIK
jgi:hypothetical protein